MLKYILKNQLYYNFNFNIIMLLSEFYTNDLKATSKISRKFEVMYMVTNQIGTNKPVINLFKSIEDAEDYSEFFIDKHNTKENDGNSSAS